MFLVYLMRINIIFLSSHLRNTDCLLKMTLHLLNTGVCLLHMQETDPSQAYQGKYGLANLKRLKGIQMIV